MIRIFMKKPLKIRKGVLIKYRGDDSEVVMPNSVTSIGNRAFYNCSRLTSITIPDSVTSIGDWAFFQLGSDGRDGALANITYRGTVAQWKKVIGNDKDSLTFNRRVMVTCTDGTVGCIMIRNGVLEKCNALFFKVVIPDSVTRIEDRAFCFCSGLTSITIPDSVTSIGNSAFYGCDSLTSITIPDSVIIIGSNAFSYCSGLTSVTIPDSVTSIGGYAFRNCRSLTSIIVEPGNSVYHSAGKCLIETASKTLVAGCKNSVIPDDGSVTSIGHDAFYGCSGLTSITIPDSVTNIGSSAFFGCSGLTSITIPNRVRSIGDWAFSGCRSLTSMTIPDSVTSIGEDAFSDCSGLTSIIIPNSVTSIGYRAFYGCIGLKSITIPDSVASIGFRAFYGCENLKNINFTGTRSQWDKIGYETEIPVICTGDTSTVSKTFDGGTSTGSMI